MVRQRLWRYNPVTGLWVHERERAWTSGYSFTAGLSDRLVFEVCAKCEATTTLGGARAAVLRSAKGETAATFAELVHHRKRKRAKR